MLDMVEAQRMGTCALARVEVLRVKFGCDGVHIERTEDGRALLGVYLRQINEQIKVAQDAEWACGMADKSSLRLYSKLKEERSSAVHLYDNSRGSALLALARAGTLPTKVYKSRFSPSPDTTCRRCGVYEETLEHVLLQCNHHYHTEEDLLRSLGLDKEPNRTSVDATKRLLEVWERENTGLAELARA